MRASRKHLVFVSATDLSRTPYADIALPALAAAGWELTVVAPHSADSILAKVRPYERVAIEIPGEESGRLRRETAALRALWASRWSDARVLYVNSQAMSLRASFALAGPRFGRRVVYHNPDYYDPIRYSAHARLEGAFCRSVDLYINNEFHRGYITQTMYRARCPVLTAPPNLPAAWPVAPKSAERRSKMAGGRDAQFVLMLHGGYGEIRMVPQLFEALALLPNHIRLVMTGGAYRKPEVDQAVERLGIADRVVRLAPGGFSEMLEYTVNADAGVLLYQNSDLGNFFTAPGRITEYVSSGLPVLATNHTGLENLVRRYDVGVCVDSTSPRDIARGVLELEKRCGSGGLARDRLRRVFLEHLAFDHWERDIVDAFAALDDGRSSSANGARPRFPWIA